MAHVLYCSSQLVKGVNDLCLKKKNEENNGYILALEDPEDLAAYAEEWSCLLGVSWDYIYSGSQKIGKDSVNTVLILPTHF